MENVCYCPFIIIYVRRMDDESGMPLSEFKLLRYNLLHSHPLTMEYHRIFKLKTLLAIDKMTMRKNIKRKKEAGSHNYG